MNALCKENLMCAPFILLKSNPCSCKDECDNSHLNIYSSEERPIKTILSVVLFLKKVLPTESASNLLKKTEQQPYLDKR